jgi:ribokinase
LDNALNGAQAGDLLVVQNETNLQVQAARIGRAMGLKVCYAAAPFEAAQVQAVLPFLDLLILNAVESEQLQAATGVAPESLPVVQVIVTLGAQGCRYFDTDKGEARHFPAVPVTPVDTTGAGDTFTGYLLAGLDRGLGMDRAIMQAGRAAAIMVTRFGTADVIPHLREVEAFGTS